MPTVKEKVAVEWQEPTAEAHWRRGRPPAEASALEAAVRTELEDDAAQRDVLVIFRRDGIRWRVQAEYGDQRAMAADADPRSTLELTRRAVEALRRAGVQAEPGFPGDPHAPSLRVGPVE